MFTSRTIYCHLPAWVFPSHPRLPPKLPMSRELQFGTAFPWLTTRFFLYQPKGWHISGMPILICHNQYIGWHPSLQKHPINSLRHMLRGQDSECIDQYVSAGMITDANISLLPIWAIFADTDMPTLISTVNCYSTWIFRLPSLKCSGRTVVCSAHCRPTVKQYSVPTVRAVNTYTIPSHSIATVPTVGGMQCMYNAPLLVH